MSETPIFDAVKRERFVHSVTNGLDQLNVVELRKPTIWSTIRFWFSTWGTNVRSDRE